MPRTERVFDRDYLLHTLSGAIRVSTPAATWLLPPTFAAWIPAGTPIVLEMPRPVRTASVLYAPGVAGGPSGTCAFAMSLLAREMARHCRRWGPDCADHGPEAAAFFEALAALVRELAKVPLELWRPHSDDPALARAIRHTEVHAAGPLTVGEVASAAAMSERTLLRRYGEELGLTWGQSLRRVRMIAAIERLLSTDDPVTTIALEVGYASSSAFNAAFRDYTGTTPSDLRRAGRDG